MSQVVVAKCPGCKLELRIPKDWMQKAMRCKKCGLVFQANAKPSRAPAPVSSLPAVSSAATIPLAAAGTAMQTATAVPAAAVAIAPAVAAQPAESFAGYGPIIRSPMRRRRGRGWGVIALLVGFLLLAGTGGIVGGAWWANSRQPRASGQGQVDPKDGGGKQDSGLDLPAAKGPFPRRLLAINVCNYLYANRINYGSHGRNIHQVVDRLARGLKVPPEQVFELTDSSPEIKAIAKDKGGAKPIDKAMVEKATIEARPVLKPIIEKTIKDFVETSRAQDRIVILFVGHVAEIEEAAYLVPLEGNLSNKDTLIPLAWVYEQLAKCKARQKVLILDVCRVDPARGSERPGGEPMGEKIDALLKEPPAGVQVLTACVAKQNSHEFNNGEIYGGIFMQELYNVIAAGKLVGIQRPDEAIPISALSEAVGKSTQTRVKKLANAEQTPRLTGKEADDGPAYNPKEALASRITIPPPPEPEGGRAGLALVKSILDDTEGLIPPIKFSEDGNDRLRAEALPPFSAKLLAEYKADDAKTPLREAILKGVEVLKSNAPRLVDRFLPPGGDDARFKANITEIQKGPGLAQLNLEEALQELEAAGKERDKEPSKRWQANYDYVLAMIKGRMAYVHEYNFALAMMKKELPPRDPEIHQGWQLASIEKLQSGQVGRNMARDAKALLKALAEEHKGTPWEVLARREEMTSLGLEWRASSFAQ